MAKILIIDDELKLRETIGELLSIVGYDVIEAQNGKEGLEKVQEHKPDLILCDIMMPILDGYGFLEQHKKSKFAHISVIFLTALIEHKDEEKGLALGVTAYFKKPFVFKDLKTIIEEHLKDKI